MNQQIRAFRDRDSEAVAALWERVFAEQAPHNAPQKILSDKLALDDPLGRELLLICEQDGQIIGTTLAGWDGHRGWLYAVAVHPAHRRQRIGESLIRAAEQALSARGCDKVNLQIRAGNEAVANFYRALGYDVEPRTSMGRLLNSN